MNMTKGTRIILLSIAALLDGGRAAAQCLHYRKSPLFGRCKTLREYGYTLDDDDFITPAAFLIPPYRIYWRGRI